MQKGREHDRRKHTDSPLDRLARDINAIGQLGASRLPAAERLRSELGDDLLGAINATLSRLNADAFPLCSKPRRAA